MRKFKGLSDFFLNATEEQRREVYLNVIEKSIASQNKILEEAESDKETNAQELTDDSQRSH